MDTSRDPKRIVNPPMSFGKKRWTEIDKKVVFAFFVLHFLCIFAPFQMNRGALSICFALFIITGLFGITISYHRNLSHKSFKIPKWLEYSFAYCGVHAFQVWHLTHFILLLLQVNFKAYKYMCCLLMFHKILGWSNQLGEHA